MMSQIAVIHRLLVITLLLVTPASALVFAAEAKPTIVAEKRGGHTVLLVYNPLPGPITATLKLDLTNAKSNVELPATVVVPSQSRQQALTIVPEKNLAWKYHYDWNYRPGDRAAKHDDTYIYRLPYPKGKSYSVMQGYDGKFSHHGEQQFAIDFKLPLGSTVCAARGGTVLMTRADSDEGGRDRDKYLNKANYIRILHDDGSIGSYVHLQHHGALVTVGEQVHAGQKIGLSGETGYATSPHLHFHVQLAVDGETIRTVAIRFRTHRSAAETLEQGQAYTAR